MLILRKIVSKLVLISAVLYLLGCTYLYFNQVNLIFFPEKLKHSYKYKLSLPHKEINFRTEDNAKLNGVLVKSALEGKPKGLIFFLHGNTGNIEDIDNQSVFYTDLGYDFFAIDYRSFGKSSGQLSDDKQFYDDCQQAYSEMEKKYPENEISIIGHSVGTGTAAYLASKNRPKRLVLLAPYYSMTDIALNRYKVIPPFLLKFKFETFKFLPKVKVPIAIIHGTKDETIPFNSSKRLAGLLKAQDLFISISNFGHVDFETNATFVKQMKRLLAFPTN